VQLARGVACLSVGFDAWPVSLDGNSSSKNADGTVTSAANSGAVKALSRSDIVAKIRRSGKIAFQREWQIGGLGRKLVDRGGVVTSPPREIVTGPFENRARY